MMIKLLGEHEQRSLVILVLFIAYYIEHAGEASMICITPLGCRSPRFFVKSSYTVGIVYRPESASNRGIFSTMRLACLQFAPQVGDTDNNISRADAVLGKANPDELDRLDLLVLPELAFTGISHAPSSVQHLMFAAGYNFRSLQHIAPYLEDDESRISYLWARKTALNYGCTVVVGYPEKVDAERPASPEHYNSAVIVDSEGDAVGNYRKSFLHCADETWARENSEGFFQGELPRLGNVCLGISTDIK